MTNILSVTLKKVKLNSGIMRRIYLNNGTGNAGNKPGDYPAVHSAGVTAKHSPVLNSFILVPAKSFSHFTNATSFPPDRPHSLPMCRPFRQIVLTFYQCVVLFAKSSLHFTNVLSFSPNRPHILPMCCPFRRIVVVFAKIIFLSFHRSYLTCNSSFYIIRLFRRISRLCGL